jgi:hypothetical protein
MTAQKIRNTVIAAFAFVAIAATSLAAQAQDDEATVKIDNRNALEVVVYAVTDDGDRYRLGSVHRLSTAELAVPTKLADGDTQFRLKVYSYEATRAYNHVSRARAAVKTQPLTAAAGDTIRLLVEARLTESYIPAP